MLGKFAKRVSGLRHNGHCEFQFKRKHYWLPAMGDLDLDIKNKWPYKFTLSEVQCGAGIIMIKKFLYFFNKHQKKYLLLLFGFMFISTILEMVGLGFIFSKSGPSKSPLFARFGTFKKDR